MEDEEGGYEGNEEAFVEVMGVDEEGEDDDEVLDEDDLDGEDIDDDVVSCRSSVVASKTPVRRRLKVCFFGIFFCGAMGKENICLTLGHSCFFSSSFPFRWCLP